MSSVPAMSTSHINFASIFNAALESYRRKTKKDLAGLASHVLLPTLQYSGCDSPEAFLSVLREQIPAFNQSQNSDDETLKWVIPIVKVLNAFSDTLGKVVGLAFPPANIIFAGIGVLLSAANDAGAACQDMLIGVFNLIEHFFQRLDIYTRITPTTAMMSMIVEIMVEVINILGIVTKEVKSGRLKRWLKSMGNSDIKDSLKKLDNLTQEEARMAHAELLKITHSVDDKVTDVDKKVKGVDETVKGIEGEVRNARSDVQDVGSKVENVKGSVQGVHDDVKDVGSMMRIAGNDIKDISSKVRDADDKLDGVKRNQLKESLLRWLSAPDPSINHNIARKAHHDDTSQWFFQGGIFNQWKSSGSLLWIHGKPGSGKTVLCFSIIEEIEALHDAGTALIAKFYFDFRDIDKQNLRNLLQSLLMQLSAQSNRCCDILSQLYSKHDRGVRKPSDRDMVECLKEMLRFEKQLPTYIIMDALDECPTTSIPSPREEVLEFVDELVGLHLPNLHICVTSRPEHDIQVVLKRLTVCPVSLHDESGQREDIANYVASFVHSNQGMSRWREEDKNLVIETLSKKADGMFRWAFCQLEILRHCFPSSIRRILEELPESLDETYECILKKIRKPNQGHAHRLLQCLVAAARPLRVEELAELLAFDFDEEKIPELNPDWRWEDQEEAVMSTCSSLVIIVEDKDSRIVQFSHFSVKEFLTADRLMLAEPDRDVSRYHIRLDTAHTILVRACLGILLRLDDGVDQDNVMNFPLARYSAQYWTTHARFQDVSSHTHIKDGIKCLFDADKPHFATWLWIYNNDQDGRSMLTIRPEIPEAVPLYYAASFGFRDLVEYFIAEHPEHVIAEGGKAVTATHVTAREGYADILTLLIAHGADVDGRGLSGQTPLHRAAWSGKVDTGRCLLDHGANINARGDGEYTPLFFAAIQGHVEFARMLLERGAAIDDRNVTDTCPLHWAAQGGDIQTVQLLLDNGAGVNARNMFDETPSQLASGPKRQEIVELLSIYGAEYVEISSENLPLM